MKSISLNGEWKLHVLEGKAFSPEELPEAESFVIPCTVPGNVELDLAKAGYLPEDLYFAENILLAQEYEGHEWWYENEFDTPDSEKGQEIILHFEGVDCLAEYWLNGTKIGETDNTYIPHDFSVAPLLKKEGKNRLFVRLRSVVREAYEQELSLRTIYHSWGSQMESIGFRKPTHSFGWDIMPRAVSAGLWRGVELRLPNPIEINQAFYVVKEIGDDYATLAFGIDLKMPFTRRGTLRATFDGRCGDSTFHAETTLFYKAQRVGAEVGNLVETDLPAPKLWWPYGYGKANLYDTVIRIWDGDTVVAEKTMRIGIRTVELDKTVTTDGVHGRFQFRINGEDILCKGSNWVPLDAYHSRDAERYDRALALVKEAGCNILRCWGGNVYEDQKFFDYCDENGIMIWQDFGMACHAYPMTEAFCKKLAEEATYIVKTNRHHPSIILWAGDNENDQMYQQTGYDPNQNILTREVLPRVISEHDIGRPYLASSPYISEEAFAQGGGNGTLSEDHLWGPRDYFKSTFYTNANAHFVSEIGYHGCPSVESVKKFISPENLWPYHDKNTEWILHSTEDKGRPSRMQLLGKQIRQIFGTEPDTLEEFSLASQIVQAEAKKYFIERFRGRRPLTGGIIWWNLLDGWPQFSDAVVDYYFEKKLAFTYIQRSQQPFCLLMQEMESWHLPLTASNDTLTPYSGTYSVTDADSGEVLAEGSFRVGKNQAKVIARIPMTYAEKRLLLIRWNANGETGFNHYLVGSPAFSLEQYKKWLPIILKGE